MVYSHICLNSFQISNFEEKFSNIINENFVFFRKLHSTYFFEATLRQPNHQSKQGATIYSPHQPNRQLRQGNILINIPPWWRSTYYADWNPCSTHRLITSLPWPIYHIHHFVIFHIGNHQYIGLSSVWLNPPHWRLILMTLWLFCQ